MQSIDDDLIVLVDGNNLLMRAHYAMKHFGFSNREGIPTGGLFGVIKTHIALIRLLAPSHIVWFFDAGGSKARKELYPEYKSNRNTKDSDVKRDFTRFEKFLSLANVRYYREHGVEADDLIAAAVNRWDSEIPKVIVSADHDLHQLVRRDPNVSILKLRQGSAKQEILRYRDILEKYSLPPSMLPELWALTGDCQPTGTQVLVRVTEQESRRKCNDPSCKCNDSPYAKREYFHCGICGSIFYAYKKYLLKTGNFCGDCRNLNGVYTKKVSRSIEDVEVGDQLYTRKLSGGYLGYETVVEKKEFEFDGDLIVASTRNGKRSSYTPNHRAIAKFGSLLGKYAVYLMKKGRSYRIGITRFTPESLYVRLSSECAESLWVLSLHDSAKEAAREERVVAWTYGLPDVTFSSHSDDPYKQETFSDFWDRVGDLTEKAEACLQKFGRDIAYPLYRARRAKGENPGRLFGQIRACNLMTGMSVLTLEEKGYASEYVEISREKYTGKVYSVELTGERTYFADGILTHNSGDNIDGVPRIGEKRGAALLHKHGGLTGVLKNEERVREYEDVVRRNLKLIELTGEEASLPVNLEECVFTEEFETQPMVDFFDEWGMNSYRLKVLGPGLYA